MLYPSVRVKINKNKFTIDILGSNFEHCQKVGKSLNTLCKGTNFNIDKSIYRTHQEEFDHYIVKINKD